MGKKTLCFVLITLILASQCAEAFQTRDELRSAYRAIEEVNDAALYDSEPSIRAPYAAGTLTDAAKKSALDTVNFLRAVANLNPVSENALYDLRCAHGATLLAANDFVDHDPPQPENMPDDFYESAHAGTSQSNLVGLNWMRPTILTEGIRYFARDDGEANLSVLGHRRWLLNPKMGETGFGLANSASGKSYVVMYALDQSADCDWSEVLWPAEGAFPVELMHKELAWSISLNPEKYDIANSSPIITLTEIHSGLTFTFDCRTGEGDGYCRVSEECFGSGACLIFRPDFSGTDFSDYCQNQRWIVRVSGLRGENEALEYAVDMVSLYVQDVSNVEMRESELEMKVGETVALSARVIPEYADDLTLEWSSGNESIARVDQNGNVTAIAAGTCEIQARSANGRADFCRITVS